MLWKFFSKMLYDKDTLFLEALILDTSIRLESELIVSIKFSIAEVQSTKYTNETWIINHLILNLFFFLNMALRQCSTSLTNKYMLYL